MEEELQRSQRDDGRQMKHTLYQKQLQVSWALRARGPDYYPVRRPDRSRWVYTDSDSVDPCSACPTHTHTHALDKARAARAAAGGGCSSRRKKRQKRRSTYRHISCPDGGRRTAENRNDRKRSDWRRCTA